MAISFDELITKYTVDDQYSDKVQKMTLKTKDFTLSVQNSQRTLKSQQKLLQNASSLTLGGGANNAAKQTNGLITAASGLGRVFGSLGGIFGGVVHIIQGGLRAIGGDLTGLFDVAKGGLMIFQTLIDLTVKFTLAAGTAMVGLAVKSLEAYANLEQVTEQLEYLRGGAASAGRAMKYITDLALVSRFQLADLREASVLLESFGLNTERVLKPASDIGAFFAGTREKLLQIVGLFGRLKGGQSGFVFGPRGIGRFGITREMLAKEGGQFAANGKFLGTNEQAIDLLIKVIEKKFGGINDKLAGTLSVAWSNIGDAGTAAMERIGSVLQKDVAPILLEITQGIKNLISSGAFERIGASMGNVVKMLGGADGFKPLIAGLIAFAVTFNNTIAGLIGMGKVLWAVFEKISGVAEAIINTATGGLFSPMKAALKGLINLSGVPDNFSSEYDKAMKALNTKIIAQAEAGVGIGNKKATAKETEVIKQTGILYQIERNTKPIFDMARTIIGGGERAQNAVSVTSLYGRRGGRGGLSGQIQSRTRRAANDLHSAIEGHLYDTLRIALRDMGLVD